MGETNVLFSIGPLEVTGAVVTFCTRFGGAASFMLCAGMPTVPAFAGASFLSPIMSCL
mgnify:CR=1 FL=1